MTHRDRAGDPSGQWAGRREAAGDAGHRRGFPTPPSNRPLPVRPRDRNGGFPRLSNGVARGRRCPASLRHALLAENLGKPSLWVIINEIWYKALFGSRAAQGRRDDRGGQRRNRTRVDGDLRMGDSEAGGSRHPPGRSEASGRSGDAPGRTTRRGTGRQPKCPTFWW